MCVPDVSCTDPCLPGSANVTAKAPGILCNHVVINTGEVFDVRLCVAMMMMVVVMVCV